MNIITWIQSTQEGGEEAFGRAIKTIVSICDNVNILGMVPPVPMEIDTLDGIPVIDKHDLSLMNYDLILVSGRNASLEPILREAAELKLEPDKIVLDRVICTPNFTFEKYSRLRRSALSILSKNCFAGLLYHRFGLKFLSPTINMFTSDEGFLKFLENPIENVKAELKFQETKFNPDLNIDYPIFKIGETIWDMNHYDNVDFAFRKWYERAFRINWFNLMVVMQTDNPEVLARFDRLPFAKKVCFVPFESDLDSAYPIIPARYGGEPLWRLVNSTATGRLNCYDIWDMLLYGRKTPLL